MKISSSLPLKRYMNQLYLAELVAEYESTYAVAVFDNEDDTVEWGIGMLLSYSPNAIIEKQLHAIPVDPKWRYLNDWYYMKLVTSSHYLEVQISLLIINEPLKR